MDPSEFVRSGLTKILNVHGHAFQYAVIRRGEELFDLGQSKWVFEAAEFPVVTGGVSFHIDFVLSHRHNRLHRDNPRRALFLVAECKRADPARNRWCFVKAPYTRRNLVEKQTSFDQVEVGPLHPVPIQSPCKPHTTRGKYHLGFELKSGMKGDGVPGDSRPINSAVAQALRGASGLLNHFAGLPVAEGDDTVLHQFVPVVFTTAEIWTSDVDISEAGLGDGQLDPESVQTEKTDWIWFVHNRSADLRHFLDWKGTWWDLDMALDEEFARAVAIVGPDGLDGFLKTNMAAWLPREV